ncbi:ATP-binding cassette domain-containing protein, partial [bacterium]|nr:ATP-binding cassette domain-containing protein [bacterium]
MNPFIRLTDIHKCYREGDRERAIFRGAELTVAPGQWIALLGRSGSGKSTLLNLISGIDLPDRGEVLVGESAINRLSERERTLFRRHRIGFVFQFYNLIPTLTVLENLLLPLELAGEATPDGHAHARELLERVGPADP